MVADEKFAYTLITLMDIASLVYELFYSVNIEQKRQLIKVFIYTKHWKAKDSITTLENR